MKNLLPVYLLMIAVLFACNDVENTPNEESVEIVIEEETIVEEPALQLDELPLSIQEQLFTKCNAIEATFYLTAQSMASNGSSLNSMISLIDFASAPTKLNKDEQGHLLFLDNGNQIVFGKISLSEESNYVKFTIEDAVYYNNLSADGVKFFNGVAIPSQN